MTNLVQNFEVTRTILTDWGINISLKRIERFVERPWVMLFFEDMV